MNPKQLFAWTLGVLGLCLGGTALATPDNENEIAIDPALDVAVGEMGELRGGLVSHQGDLVQIPVSANLLLTNGTLALGNGLENLEKVLGEWGEALETLILSRDDNSSTFERSTVLQPELDDAGNPIPATAADIVQPQ